MFDLLTEERSGDVVKCHNLITAKEERVELVKLKTPGDKTYELEDGKYVREAWIVKSTRSDKGQTFVKSFYRKVPADG